VMNGRVESLPTSMKVPHMGWNSLQIRQDSRLIEGIKNDSWVYFVHSYMARPATTATYEKIVTAESHYSTAVPAVVEQDGYFGTQFHPEKSGRVGRRIIKNFIGICNG